MNSLQNHGIQTVEDVEAMADGQLLQIRAFGKTSLRHVRRATAEYRNDNPKAAAIDPFVPSLRQYFAAHALACLSQADYLKLDELARDAFVIADAMLAREGGAA